MCLQKKYTDPAPPKNGATALWNLYFPFESLLNYLFYIQLWEWMVCSMLKFTTLFCVFSLEYGYFPQTAEGRIKYRLTVKDIQGFKCFRDFWKVSLHFPWACHNLPCLRLPSCLSWHWPEILSSTAAERFMSSQAPLSLPQIGVLHQTGSYQKLLGTITCLS